MGQTTPNIGIYIPAAGETNYDQAFMAGMMNIDLHDHSGGPNKGVPITNSGLADFSVTYNKLNSNVVDPTTGVGVHGSPFQNQIYMLGILANLFTLSGVPGQGFVSMNGSTVNARTFQNSSTVTWTNPDGISGNPSAAFNIAGISPVTVPNGGTGLTALSPWDILCGGNTSTGNVQQVSGEGTLGQVLTSQGPLALPIWAAIPTVNQNLLQATLSMTASQFNSLSGTPIQIVPAPGAGKVIVPYNAYGKVTYGGSDRFHSGSSVRFYWGAGAATDANCFFESGTFTDSFSAYYIAIAFEPSSTTGIPIASMENQPLVVSVNSSNFSGGAGNVVTMSMQYSIINI